MYAGDQSQRKLAHEVLTQVRTHPDSWFAVDTILATSHSPDTKFFALNVLENVISTRWMVLTEPQKAGIKNYVVQLVIKISADEHFATTQKHVLTKLNETLVNIVKQEWPHAWENFIPDICGSCKTNQLLCENNLRILNMMSEEIFTFGKSQMVSKKVAKLKESLNSQFAAIYELCSYILKSHVQSPGSVKTSLITTTLSTLANFLEWIALAFIFETDLIQILLLHFWDPLEYRLDCARCLNEIACLHEGVQQYQPQIIQCFQGVVEKIQQLPENISEASANLPAGPQRVFWEVFHNQVALLLTGFLKHHMAAMEAQSRYMIPALNYLVRISMGPNEETFKICVEFWQTFSARVYLENQAPQLGQMQAPLLMDGHRDSQREKLKLYAPVLAEVRQVLISKMAKPPEVTIKENEEGHIVPQPGGILYCYAENVALGYMDEDLSGVVAGSRPLSMFTLEPPKPDPPAGDVEWNHVTLMVNGKLPLEPVSTVVENCFCCYFSLEIFIRFFGAKTWCSCCKDLWFLFDLTLVILMVLETWVLPLVALATGGGPDISGLSSLRLLRLLRLTRPLAGVDQSLIKGSKARHGAGLVHGMDGRDGRFQWDRRERGGEGAPEVRFMRFFPELLTLVRGMARAMQSVAWVLLFLLIVTYIFAIVFTSQLGTPNYQRPPELVDAEDPLAPELFSDMFASMMSLFEAADRNGDGRIAEEDPTLMLTPLTTTLVRRCLQLLERLQVDARKPVAERLSELQATIFRGAADYDDEEDTNAEAERNRVYLDFDQFQSQVLDLRKDAEIGHFDLRRLEIKDRLLKTRLAKLQADLRHVLDMPADVPIPAGPAAGSEAGKLVLEDVEEVPPHGATPSRDTCRAHRPCRRECSPCSRDSWRLWILTRFLRVGPRGRTLPPGRPKAKIGFGRCQRHFSSKHCSHAPPTLGGFSGFAVRVEEEDTDELALYKMMREALIYLTHLDSSHMERIVLQRVAQECLERKDMEKWIPTNLNRLCYAIGSISGAMQEADERRFVVSVIKDLLSLCDMKKGKENKAAVASNVMYVVGQYPRFLRAHWKFLKTVVFKLFEFMHETFPGVQQMAVDTFLRICQKCKKKFITQQNNEPAPFIETMPSHIAQDISELEPLQICTFFEAVGHMISAASSEQKVRLIALLMGLFNDKWAAILRGLSATGSLEAFVQNQQVLREISLILRVNERVVVAIGTACHAQLAGIYGDMLKIYKVCSDFISHSTAQQGAQVMNLANVKLLRNVKRDTLRLVRSFVDAATPQGAAEVRLTPAQIAQRFVPPLLEPVLADYRSNMPQARDAEVLDLLTVLATRIHDSISQEVGRIFEMVLECTCDMIKGDFQSYPDHRVKFYDLLKAINANCFQALFYLPEAQLILFVDSLIWAMKHEQPQVADSGLQVLSQFLERLLNGPSSIYVPFFKQYYFLILQAVIGVLTDTFHKSGFKLQQHILLQLIVAAENQMLSDAAPKQRVMEFLFELIGKSFPTLNKSQAEIFVLHCFNKSRQPVEFQQHIRDFLIQLKGVAGCPCSTSAVMFDVKKRIYRARCDIAGFQSNGASRPSTTNGGRLVQRQGDHVFVFLVGHWLGL
eukprot:s4000_g3.t2